MPHGFKLCLEERKKEKKKRKGKKRAIYRDLFISLGGKKDVRRIHSKIAAWAIATITKASNNNNKNECT